MKQLFALGVEKVVLNTAVATNPGLVAAAASLAGSSSIVVSVDVRRGVLGKYGVYVRGGQVDLRCDPVAYAREVEQLGAGEILLNAIDRDGTQSGYDLELVRRVAETVSIPVVAAGGAGCLQHFRSAVDVGASAVAAGSLFVFHGKHRAVLITYPVYHELEELFRA